MSLNKKEIENVLNKIRPSLQMDGGDVELVNVDEKTGKVEVRLQGACSHCPMSSYTLKDGIEAELKNHLPEIKEVVAV